MIEVYIDESVKKVRKLHQELLLADKSAITIPDFLAAQAEQILKAHQSQDASVVFHLACWCSQLISKPPSEIMTAELTQAMVQQTIAREHGFEDWASVEALHNTMFDLQFESCIDTMLAGDISKLKTMLTKEPALATQRSQYGHRATLLHYLAANGVESYRQVTPLNAAVIAQSLIDAGADANANANIYGGSKPLELLTTSAHPANAGVVDEVSAVLQKSIRG